MHTRTLIGITATTLVLSLSVVGGLWQIDRTTPAHGMQRSAAASSVQALPERPVVPEPDDPEIADVTLPAESLTSRALEPRRAPVLAPVPGPAAERVTVAVLVLPAPGRVAEPQDPVLAGDDDLAERLVAPELSPVELRAPSLAAALMPPAPGRVAKPQDPVPVVDEDLAERLVAPELSPVENRAPSLALVSSDCRASTGKGSL